MSEGEATFTVLNTFITMRNEYCDHQITQLLVYLK